MTRGTGGTPALTQTAWWILCVACAGVALLTRTGATAEIHWQGSAGNMLWTDPANWEPILEGDPPEPVQRAPGSNDVAVLNDPAQSSVVSLPPGAFPAPQTSIAVGELRLENGLRLQNNGTRLVVRGTGESAAAQVTGDGTRLEITSLDVYPHRHTFQASSLSVDGGAVVTVQGDRFHSRESSAIIGTVNIGSEAMLELSESQVEIDSLAIGAEGSFVGQGIVELGDTLINDGTISVPVGTRGRASLWIRGRDRAMIDLDGSSEAGTLVINDGTTWSKMLFIDAPLTDPFNGSIIIGDSDSLSLPEIADSTVTIDRRGGLSVSSVSNSTVTLTGGGLTVGTVSGPDTRIEILPGNSSTLRGNIQFREGVLKVDDALDIIGSVRFDAAARLDLSGAESINFWVADAGSPGPFIINQSILDLDGDSEQVALQFMGMTILEVNELDDDDEAFDGSLFLEASGGIGRDQLIVDKPDRWMSRGTITVNTYDQRLSGAPVTIDGTLRLLPAFSDVEQGPRSFSIEADATFTENAKIRISADPTLALFGGDPKLHLQGTTSIGGGEWIGGSEEETAFGGVVFDSPSATIVAPTSMSFGTIDLDGLEPGRSLEIQQPLSLNVSRVVDESPVDDGTVRIGPAGTLEVNLSTTTQAPVWFARNRFDLIGDFEGFTEHLAGSAVQLHGSVAVEGHSAWTARAEIVGDVMLAEDAILRLDGGTLVPAAANRIFDGAIRGNGTLQASPGHGLTGFGEIETTVEFDRTNTLLAAHLGTLTLSGPLVSVGTIGTSNVDATLRITRPWNTSVAQEVYLDRGTLAGAAITNDSVIRGRGTIRSQALDNVGLLESAGAILILGDTLTISTQTPPDLDGSSDLNGEGIIRARDGHIVITGDVSADFHGTLEIGGGYSFSLTHPETGLRIAPGMDDPDGSGDVGRIELDDGTLRGAFFHQASELVVAESGGTIEAATIAFQSRGQNVLNGDLTLRGDAQIHDGAAFSGPGKLINAADSTLAIDPGIDIAAGLTNEGRLGFVASPGAFTVDSFAQSNDAAVAIRLSGDGSDKIASRGTAALAGTLQTLLADGFQPAAASEFEVLSAAVGVLGTFEDVLLPDLSDGLAWQIDYGPSNVLLRVVGGPIMLPGDYNGNGLVEQADLDLVLSHWGRDAGIVPPEWKHDPPIGLIDQTELDRVLANWGNATSAANRTLQAIPEPASAQLAALVGMAALIIGRCCRSVLLYSTP